MAVGRSLKKSCCKRKTLYQFYRLLTPSDDLIGEILWRSDGSSTILDYDLTVRQMRHELFTWFYCLLFCPLRYKFLSIVLLSTKWHCIRFGGYFLPNCTLFCISSSKHPINIVTLHHTAEHERCKHWTHNTTRGKYAHDHEGCISLYECIIVVLFFHAI